jgi:hypothetical protein
MEVLMRKTALILASGILLILSSSSAWAQTPASQPVPMSIYDQGKAMVQQGDEMIREGQILKDTGTKLMQQNGATTTPAILPAPAVQSTTQTTTVTTPATTAQPGLANPSQVLQNLGQYQQYVQQGQQLLKNPKSLIPGMK